MSEHADGYLHHAVPYRSCPVCTHLRVMHPDWIAKSRGKSEEREKPR